MPHTSVLSTSSAIRQIDAGLLGRMTLTPRLSARDRLGAEKCRVGSSRSVDPLMLAANANRPLAARGEAPVSAGAVEPTERRTPYAD